ncbi:hypothetical protein ACEPAG_3295 [Sanghuangporus baumii]
MPSLFSRARTTSSKTAKAAATAAAATAAAHSPDAVIDEFGRVSSRGAGAPPLPLKDKRSQSLSQSKRATHTSAADYELDTEVEDGFLPTSLNSPQDEVGGRVYGYLGHEANIVLSIEDLERLVKVVADEIIQRGLTTPFLFSNTALDLNASSVRRLIDTFLRTPDIREEVRFANPHALASFLRWGLARPVRIVSGMEFRGIIDWEAYLRWRHVEQAGNFRKAEFSSFVGLLHPQLRSLILTLFSLFSRLLANSTSSGLTPAALASLFGPLLFGLPTASFHSAYTAYLRSAHATEHLLLSYVRLQVSEASPSAPPPRRLISWVQGYPATLAPIDSFERPRLGARTRRVASVRRNVRLYSEDLVRTCAAWAKGPEGAAVRNSKEWGRIAPEKRDGSRLDPRYSDTYRKKLDLPPGFHPSTSIVLAVPSSPLSTPPLSTTSSSASTRSSLFDDPVEEAKFRSLTDMKWGEFSMIGFGDVAPSALQFDLTESARNARAAKRQTLTWNDFSTAGFSRSDASFSQTLQFSPPLQQTVQQWPQHEKEVHRKLKKNIQKVLPPFGWDTAPIMDGRENVIEDGFLDVFCDILYGGGWIDRTETTFRECNWALVEFKSLPTSRSESSATSASLSLTSTADANDPRTSSTLLLFEEFVPAEYRSSLLSQGTKPNIRRGFGIASLLSPKKGTGKQWKQAATLNGRPYAIGTVPKSPNAREAEFERLLAGGSMSTTKMLSLGSSATVGHAAAGPLRVDTPTQEPKMSTSSAHYPMSPVSGSTAGPPPPFKSNESPDQARTASPFSPASLRKPRFRFPGSRENRGIIPSEYETVDFDTRLASYSDDELNGRSSAEGSKAGPAGAKRKNTKEKRMSKDDAWVDILVASGGKRMANQDAEMRPRGTGTLGVGTSAGAGRSDPELASMEVAQALAAVRHPSPTSDDEVDRNEAALPGDANSNGNGHGHSYANIDVDYEDDLTQSPPKRRLNYFDLHPERRPVNYDEPRHSATSGYGDSVYSEGDFEPTTSIGDGEPPYSDAGVDVSAAPDTTPGRTDINFGKDDLKTMPTTQSKTASLIEMYRERERQQNTSSTAPLNIQKPSRIPIRSSSLPQEEGNGEKPAPTVSTTPFPVQGRDPSPDLEDDDESVDIQALEPGAPYTFSELGRSSPGRYVHGAPLHNVLEEEEES